MIGQPQYPQEFLTFSKTEGEKRDSPVFLAVFPNTSLDVELVKKVKLMVEFVVTVFVV